MNKTMKPWGFEVMLENNGLYVVKLLHVNPGEQLSRQYHEVKRESMYCLQGIGKLLLEIGEGPDTIGTMHILQRGSFHQITPRMIHTLSCDMDSLEQLVILECSTPEIEDIVRLADKYGRVKGK